MVKITFGANFPKIKSVLIAAIVKHFTVREEAVMSAPPTAPRAPALALHAQFVICGHPTTT